MSEHPPVRDWATDFDHTDEAWAADPYPIWDQLRRTCPVAHSDRYGGTWLPTRHEDVAAIAYDTENFTSRSVVVTNYRPPDLAPRGIAPPISSDPPFHAGARRMLLPLMSPHVIARWEPSTREYCETLVEDLRGRDAIDAAVEYAQHIPVRVIARMLGFPEADADLFRGFVHHVLESVTLPFEQRFMGMQDIFEYLRVQVQDHIENPRDDLTTALLTAHMNDEPVGIEHVGGTVALLLLAGIDTTWSAIGASIWHLGGHPADRERLVAEPQLLPTAIEEFLRA
ncbi:MAG: cytochrome P450, partial [Acidimicrobiia bacterium]|nr:cytochrome P450 [Acidimicrobiia bacterium]